MPAADQTVTPATDGPLFGGTANRGRVIRVGHTVRRPAAPYRAATHALLTHLAAAGFDGAPRVIAADATTDTLTYIDGRAATPPMYGEMLTDAALASIGDLLRGYHQAVASFDPAGYRWPRRIPARFLTGLVSHNDVYPANIIFRGGRAGARQRRDVAEAIIANHDWDCAIITEGVRSGHAGFIDAWNENGGTMIRARRWCEAHQRELVAAAA